MAAPFWFHQQSGIRRGNHDQQAPRHGLRGESGFTLVELLVVMLIIGLLAAIAIPAFFNQRNKANDASAKERPERSRRRSRRIALTTAVATPAPTSRSCRAIEATVPALCGTAAAGTLCTFADHPERDGRLHRHGDGRRRPATSTASREMAGAFSYPCTKPTPPRTRAAATSSEPPRPAPGTDQRVEPTHKSSGRAEWPERPLRPSQDLSAEPRSADLRRDGTSDGSPCSQTIPEPDLRAEDGMTLVEVLVSMLLVGLIALSFLGLDAVGRTTADQRRVAQATQIAQADQERLRGMSADQLATLDQTRTVTLDSVDLHGDVVGKYQSATQRRATAAPRLARSADYAKVTSTVDLAEQHSPDGKSASSAIVEQSLITPRVGGSLLVQAQDQGAAALAGRDASPRPARTRQQSSVIRTGTTDARRLRHLRLAAGRELHGDDRASPATSTRQALRRRRATSPRPRAHDQHDGPARSAGQDLPRPSSGSRGPQATTRRLASRAQRRRSRGSTRNMATAGVSDPSTDLQHSSLDDRRRRSSRTSSAPRARRSPATTPFTPGSCTADPAAAAPYQSYATVPPAGTAATTANGRVIVPKMPVINVSVDLQQLARSQAGAHQAHRPQVQHTWAHRSHRARPSRRPDGCSPRGSRTAPATRSAPTTHTPHVVGRLQLSQEDRRRSANTSFTASDGNTVTVAIPNSSSGTYRGCADGRRESTLARLRGDESGLTLIEMLVVIIIATSPPSPCSRFQDLALAPDHPGVRQGRRDSDSSQRDREDRDAACTRPASPRTSRRSCRAARRRASTFISKYGSAATVTPEKLHKIAPVSGTSLTDTTYPVASGTARELGFSSTPTSAPPQRCSATSRRRSRTARRSSPTTRTTSPRIRRRQPTSTPRAIRT